MLHGGGLNNLKMLGIPSDSRKNGEYVSKLTEIPVKDCNNIRCVAPGWRQTVIVTNDGDVLAAGSLDVLLGKGNSGINETFAKITVCEEDVTWAATGKDYTLYTTKSGRAILYHKDMSEKIEVPLQNRAFAVFGGTNYGGIIDEDGCAYFISKNDPKKTPTRHVFPSPAVELACCDDFYVVLLSDFRVFGNLKLNNNKESFAQVASLNEIKITKISGCYYTCLALGDDGNVYSYGCNTYGQLGDGTTSNNYQGFKKVEVPNNSKIRDIASSGHSLLLSNEGALYGCGWNKYNQLFHKSAEEKVLNFVQIDVSRKLSHIYVGSVHSLPISGIYLQNNPAKMMYMHPIQRIMFSKFDELKKNIEQLENHLDSANIRINEMKVQIQQGNDELLEKIDQKDRRIEQLENHVSEMNQRIEGYQQHIFSLINCISDLGLSITDKK